MFFSRLPYLKLQTSFCQRLCPFFRDSTYVLFQIYLNLNLPNVKVHLDPLHIFWPKQWQTIYILANVHIYNQLGLSCKRRLLLKLRNNLVTIIMNLLQLFVLVIFCFSSNPIKLTVRNSKENYLFVVLVRTNVVM